MSDIQDDKIIGIKIDKREAKFTLSKDEISDCNLSKSLCNSCIMLFVNELFFPLLQVKCIENYRNALNPFTFVAEVMVSNLYAIAMRGANLAAITMLFDYIDGAVADVIRLEGLRYYPIGEVGLTQHLLEAFTG